MSVKFANHNRDNVLSSKTENSLLGKQIKQIFRSRTFKFIQATPKECSSVLIVIKAIYQDPVVKSGQELLRQTGDRSTQLHEYRVMGTGHIIIERIIQVYGQICNLRKSGSSLPEIPPEQLLTLEDTMLFDLSAATHDVGKYREDIQSIVRSPARISSAEKQIIDEHSVESAIFVNRSSWRSNIKHGAVVLNRAHHAYKADKPVGSKVTGKYQLLSEIEAFADMLDALASDGNSGRPYKRAYNRIETIKILEEDFTGQYKDLLLNICFTESRVTASY